MFFPPAVSCCVVWVAQYVKVSFVCTCAIAMVWNGIADLFILVLFLTADCAFRQYKR